MYCYGSKLRTEDMTLKDIAEKLEVSQGDIAIAVGISKTSVNEYIHEYCGNQKTLDSIYRYLNSREFYNGYSFMPTKDFARFLNTEVLSVFRKTMKQSEIAKAIGMTPQKLSKLIGCIYSDGKTQKLNVREQYDILEKLYNMCAELAPDKTEKYIDDNDEVTNEFVKLRVKLNKHIHIDDDIEIKMGFSSLLNFIIKKGFRAQLYCVLKEICKIEFNDYHRIIQDDEFIMSLKARYRIIGTLDRKIGDFSSELHEKFKFILMEGEFDEDEMWDEDFRQVDLTVLYKYSNMLCRVILEHYYAFIDNPLYSIDKKNSENSSETDSMIWRQPEYIKKAKYRVRIVEEFHTLSANDKASVCKEFADKILEHMKQKGVSPLKHEFDENGKLLINTDHIYCRQLSDINDIIEIVSRIGPLENLRTDFTSISLDDEYPFENRDYFLNLLPNTDSYYSEDWEEIIDKKLDFDAMDWNLWGLLTQALHLGISLEDIYKFIVNLKKDKKHDFSIAP